MVIRKIATSVFFAVIFFTVSSIASVRVTEDSPQQFSFIFDLQDFSVTPYHAAGRQYSRISWQAANTEVFDQSRIALPSQSLYVGVPHTGTPRVVFTALSVKRIVLDHPLFIDDTARIDSVTNPAFTNPWISDIRYVYFRGLKTAHLFIRPFLYDPRTRTLSVLEKASGNILFPATAAQRLNRRMYTPQNSSAYYAMLQRLVHNFATATQWIDTPQPGLRKSGSLSHPQLPAASTMVRFTVGDGVDGVNETLTDENGIIKITYDDVKALSSSSIPMHQISLYGSIRHEIDSFIPSPDSIPSGVVEIPLLRCDRNRNRVFDPGDYLLAYVTNVNDWYYDTTDVDTMGIDTIGKGYYYLFNHYEKNRHYWLRISGNGLPITRFNPIDTAGVSVITHFTNRLRFKKSVMLESVVSSDDPKGGKEWVWKRIGKGGDNSFSYQCSLADLEPSLPGKLRLLAGFYTSNDLAVSFGNTPVADTGAWIPITSWGNSVLDVQLANNSGSHFYEMKAFDILYSRALDMAGKKTLRIFSPTDSSIVSYRLTNLPAEKVYIFRIHTHESIVHLIDTVTAGGTYSWIDTSGIGIQYVVAAESGLLSIDNPQLYSSQLNSGYYIRNLYNTANMADMIILSHRDFFDQAQQLAEHKIAIGRVSYPRIVATEDVYREFSGGNQDPGAIRNFLSYATHYWAKAPGHTDPGPDYVILFGNGNYDYKGYTTTEPNFIPTAQFDDMCVDDFFSCLSPAGAHPMDYITAPSVFMGRIPCVSALEAQNVVDKIKQTEGAEADFGGWRNRILFISDDDMQGGGEDFINHWEGNEDIELALLQQYPSVDSRKVYLFEYPWNEAYEKPEASAALFSEIKSGVAWLNYFGHANHEAWADERILEFHEIENFANKKRYPVMTLFSCSVAYFDKPDHASIGDKLVTVANKGAAAVIASARTAFATSNMAMAKEFYRLQFDKSHSWALGQSYAITKATNNLKRYVLFGDPSVKIMNVTDTVAMNIIANNAALKDTLKALQVITVNGTVKKIGTAAVSTATDSVLITLYNPFQDSVKRKDGGKNQWMTYRMQGKPVASAITEVHNGTFSQQILIPKRLTYNKRGVRLTAYSWGGGRCATGTIDSLIFFGTSDSLINDTQGPQITIRPVYDSSAWNASASFTDQISALLPLECEVNVWDDNGIDVTGTGPDEGLSYEIAEINRRENINHKFGFSEGKFTQGKASVVFEQGDLEPGTYTMVISAQDLLCNVSKVSITLEILSAEQFDLGRVFNYPNPMRMETPTRFFFFHANTSQEWNGSITQAAIKIFSLSGRLLYYKRGIRNGEQWNGTDQTGTPLPPNIYLYRISMEVPNNDLMGGTRIEKSPIKKLVILPP